MRQTAVGIFAIAAMLGAIACGGKTSSNIRASPDGTTIEDSSHQPKPQSRFIAEAETICAKTKNGLAALLHEEVRLSTNRSLSGQQALVRQRTGEAGLQRMSIRKLAALTPPHALQNAYRRYLNVRRERIVLVPWRSKNRASLGRLSERRAKVDRDGAKLAQTMGFKVCS